MNCEQATEFMDLRTDGELAVASSESLDAHLIECRSCRTLSAQMERLDAALADLARENDSMLAHGRPESWVRREPVRSSSRWGVLGGLAAAACVGLMALVSSALLDGLARTETIVRADRPFSVRLFGESEQTLLAAHVDSGVAGVHLVYLARITRADRENAATQPASRM